jgi:hypothetical protein
MVAERTKARRLIEGAKASASNGSWIRLTGLEYAPSRQLVTRGLEVV